MTLTPRTDLGELFALLTLAVTFVLATIVLNTPPDGGRGVNLGAVRLRAAMRTPSSRFYLLAPILGTLHNLWHYQKLMADMRAAIAAGTFQAFRESFYAARLAPQ